MLISNNIMNNLENTLKKNNINNILNIYLVGSKLYGNDNLNSDYDFLVVTKNINGKSINNNLINATIFSEDKFQEGINDYKMLFLEALFSDKKFKIKESVKFDFKYDKNSNKLYDNTIKNMKETYNKVLTNNNHMIKVKKLAHCYRLYDSMMQIHKYDSIMGYEDSNDIFNKLSSDYNLFLEYKERMEKQIDYLYNRINKEKEFVKIDLGL